MVYIREAIDRKQENMRRRRRRDALRLQLVRVLESIAENGTFGISPFVLERETMSLHPTFVEYIDGARLYLEAETDKDNSSMREVKTHFCDFIRKMIKNFSLESCVTLLSRELKRNLVNLFTSWSGTHAIPFGSGVGGGSSGTSHHAVSSSTISSISADEEKLQYSALLVRIARKRKIGYLKLTAGTICSLTCSISFGFELLEDGLIIIMVTH